MNNENIVKIANNMICKKADGCCKIRIPKRVATIKLCGGALTFDINDTMQWQRPTDE